jgi:glycosyltransferase involved in cell wall biosynthesis
MGYPIFDVEVTNSLADLPLGPSDEGAAILVRRKGVPIAFWIQERTGNTVQAEALKQRIATEAGLLMVSETVREEMARGRADSTAPTVTIAICTRDRPDGVERLLRSISKWNPASDDYGGTGIAETLVVDNVPSDDRTRDLVLRSAGVRYVRESRPGLNFARNRAVTETRTEILAFLDDDVIPDGGWLQGLYSAWRANRDAAGFTGQVLPLELETDAQIVFEKRGGFRRGFQRVRYGAVLPGDPLYPGGAGNFGAGANMAFRTDALRAIGGFDEALDTGADVPGGGDLDIFYRIIRSGRAIVYEPRFLVFHQHRREMSALRRQYERSWGLGFMCYLSKCLRTDPERRINLLRLVLWWFTNHTGGVVKHLGKRMRGEDHVPLGLLTGELKGGVVGLLGGYERSRRRIGAIRRRPVG